MDNKLEECGCPKCYATSGVDHPCANDVMQLHSVATVLKRIEKGLKLAKDELNNDVRHEGRELGIILGRIEAFTETLHEMRNNISYAQALSHFTTNQDAPQVAGDES